VTGDDLKMLDEIEVILDDPEFRSKAILVPVDLMRQIIEELRREKEDG